MTAVHANLFDTQWLTDEHKTALWRAELRLPEFTNQDHDAVLVSVPDIPQFTDVAWVDIGLAQIVWLLYHRLGIQTIEGCQDGERGDYAYLTFINRVHRRRFQRIVGIGRRCRHGWCGHCVWFSPDEIPLIEARLGLECMQ